MMRASTWLKTLDTATLRELGDRYGAAPEPLAILSAMRGAGSWMVAQRACRSAAAREDLTLLCANPFDPVDDDEVIEPAPLIALGLLIPLDEGGYDINIDLALTLAPLLPLEFGFAGTLLARLSPSDRLVVTKAFEIGPRPSLVDTILDVVAQLESPEAVSTRLARLRDTERAPIFEALEQGELPDELDQLDPDAAAPVVRLGPGAAGQVGLVLRVSVPGMGVEERLVVPLELAGILPDLLEQVPAPPEVVAAKPRKRPVARGPRKTRSAAEEESGSLSAEVPGTRSSESQPLRPVGSSDLSMSGMSRPDPFSGNFGNPRDSASGAFTSPYRLGRVSAIRPASAFVDLEAEKIADAALADPTLAADILEVVVGSIVVLKAGVDAEAWAERCALRLGL